MLPTDAERCLLLMLGLLLCVPPASQAPGAGAGLRVAGNDSLVGGGGQMMSSTAAAAAGMEDEEEEDATEVLPASPSTTPNPPVHPPTTLAGHSMTDPPTTSPSTQSTPHATDKTKVNDALTWSVRDKLQPSLEGGASAPQMMSTDTRSAEKADADKVGRSKNGTLSEGHPSKTIQSGHKQSSDVSGDIQTVIPTSHITVQPTNLTLHLSSPSTRHPNPVPSTSRPTRPHQSEAAAASLSPQEHLPPSFHNDHDRHPHHSSKPEHVENVRGPGPYFRPPGAISRQHHHHSDNAWEVDPNCWPRCENVTSPEGQKRMRKHSSFKHKKFYNYKLLYDTLKHQGSLKRQETEYYAWIFGATMLTLGSLTTLTSCVVFCVCGDKLKKRRQKRKSKDKCGQYYQRVDSVSSMVDSHVDPQDYIEQFDSVTII